MYEAASGMGGGAKVYDPFVVRDIVENQMHDLDDFLHECKLIVIMVAHTQIKNQMERLKGKIVFDTKNICKLEGTYKL